MDEAISAPKPAVSDASLVTMSRPVFFTDYGWKETKTRTLLAAFNRLQFSPLVTAVQSFKNDVMAYLHGLLFDYLRKYIMKIILLD